MTIDDGPDPADTPEILDVLAHYDARATFFGVGEKIQRWPYLARAILQAGHQLQNHTLNHQAGSFWAAFPHRVEQEISKCSEIIAETTGIHPTQFRSPVGLANPFVHAATEKAQLKMIGWSATGLDGICHNSERVVERILHSVAPGSIILTHEGALPGMRQGSRARTLANLLKGLRRRHYQIIIPMI